MSCGFDVSLLKAFWHDFSKKQKLNLHLCWSTSNRNKHLFQI